MRLWVQKEGKHIKILFIIAFYLLYWFICYINTGTDKKNLVGLRSYPDSVQRVVRARRDLGKEIPPEKSIATIFLSNLMMFTVVFSLLGLLLKDTLGLTDFLTAFWFFLVLGEGLGVFDLLIIDMLWWRNTKRVRFSFLPDKEHYRDPTKHIASFWRGIPLFAAVAALSAALVTLL